jgi:hypothetical protein
MRLKGVDRNYLEMVDWFEIASLMHFGKAQGNPGRWTLAAECFLLTFRLHPYIVYACAVSTYGRSAPHAERVPFSTS